MGVRRCWEVQAQSLQPSLCMGHMRATMPPLRANASQRLQAWEGCVVCVHQGQEHPACRLPPVGTHPTFLNMGTSRSGYMVGALGPRFSSNAASMLKGGIREQQAKGCASAVWGTAAATAAATAGPQHSSTATAQQRPCTAAATAAPQHRARPARPQHNSGYSTAAATAQQRPLQVSCWHDPQIPQRAVGVSRSPLDTTGQGVTTGGGRRDAAPGQQGSSRAA